MTFDVSLEDTDDGVEDVTPTPLTVTIPPSGEFLSLFSTPSSLASGSTGGDGFSSGVGSLVLVSDPKSVCGGGHSQIQRSSVLLPNARRMQGEDSFDRESESSG